MVPRTTNASVTRVMPVGLASPPIPANTGKAYPAGSPRRHPISWLSRADAARTWRSRSPGAPVRAATPRTAWSTVSTVSISSTVLSGRRRAILREPEREAGPVAARSDDDVEGDLDDHRRLDLPVAPEGGDRVRLEPAGHLGDLRVGQAAVGLADVHQASRGRCRGSRRCSRSARRGACRGRPRRRRRRSRSWPAPSSSSASRDRAGPARRCWRGP